MPRIVSVWFPAWPIERLRRHTPACVPGNTPFALVEAGGHGLTITAANTIAMQQGVAVGATLADVRAALPNLMTAPAEPRRDSAALLGLARWLGRYGPAHNCDGLDGAWIDVTGVPHLFGGERPLLDDLVRRFSAQGITARVGLADTLGGAHALARFGPPHASPNPAATSIAAPGRTREALAGLPVAALRLPSETVHLLGRLGLKRIGALYGLPRVALERRFRDSGRGASARKPGTQTARGTAAGVLLRLDQALGLIGEPRAALAPLPETAVRWPFPEPLISAEGIAAALDGLAGDLCGRLAAQGLGGRRFTLTLYRSDGTVAEVRAGTSAPSRDPAHLGRLIGEKLGSIDAGFGIDLMLLAVCGLEPLVHTQATLVTQPPDGQVRTAQAEPGALIDRLTSRLGESAVLRLEQSASHRPERAQRLRPAMLGLPWSSPEAASRRDRPHPARPAFLLHYPEPVGVVAEVPHGAPARLHWRRVVRRIVRAQGPERIAPEWWRGHSIDPLAANADAPHLPAGSHPATRDYWRLEDEAGAGYWVFREGLYEREEDATIEGADGDPRWYLQGLFA